MKRSILAFLTALLLCFGPSAWIFISHGVQAQVCPNRQCSLQTISDADDLLNLTDTEKTNAETTHLLGGRPIPSASATNEHMIHQHEWITWYDDDLRVPIWVAYELTRADASAQLTRRNCFRRDLVQEGFVFGR